MSDCIPRVLSAIKDKVPCRVYTLGLTCKQISMQTQMYVNNKKSIVWEYSVSIIAFLPSLYPQGRNLKDQLVESPLTASPSSLPADCSQHERRCVSNKLSFHCSGT